MFRANTPILENRGIEKNSKILYRSTSATSRTSSSNKQKLTLVSQSLSKKNSMKPYIPVQKTKSGFKSLLSCNFNCLNPDNISKVFQKNFEKIDRRPHNFNGRRKDLLIISHIQNFIQSTQHKIEPNTPIKKLSNFVSPVNTQKRFVF